MQQNELTPTPSPPVNSPKNWRDNWRDKAVYTTCFIFVVFTFAYGAVNADCIPAIISLYAAFLATQLGARYTTKAFSEYVRRRINNQFLLGSTSADTPSNGIPIADTDAVREEDDHANDQRILQPEPGEHEALTAVLSTRVREEMDSELKRAAAAVNSYLSHIAAIWSLLLLIIGRVVVLFIEGMVQHDQIKVVGAFIMIVAPFLLLMFYSTFLTLGVESIQRHFDHRSLYPPFTQSGWFRILLVVIYAFVALLPDSKSVLDVKMPTLSRLQSVFNKEQTSSLGNTEKEITPTSTPTSTPTLTPAKKSLGAAQ